MRKFFYNTLSVLLFIFLVATAWSSAATITFSKPGKVEGWLNESKLYEHFVDTAIEQTQKSPDQAQADSNTASLNDPAVQQAAKAAFTPDTVKKAVNTFLDANYAWLQGKTTKPEFTINLTQAKATLAANLGVYAQQRATTLPHCKTLEAVRQAAQDYLAATCIPVTVTPAQVGAAVTEDAATSKDFLGNPVITSQTFSASTIKGDSNASPSQPYYQKLSSLPSAYRLATAIPWILIILTLFTAVGVVYSANRKRTGLRRVSKLLISAGLVVLLLMFIAGGALQRVENKVFTQDNVGQLQKSLVDFAHHAQSALAAVDLWFGIGFIITGVALYIFLKYIRPDGAVPVSKNPKEPTPSVPPNKTPASPTLIQS